MNASSRRLPTALFGLLLAVGGCAAPASAPAAKPGAATASAPPAAVTASATALAGGAAPAAASPAAPAERITLHTGVTGTDPPNGVLVAAERGYFAEQGLDVEWSRIGVSAEVMRTVALGQIDVGFGATGPALSNLVNRGAQLYLVANTNQSRANNPSLCWVVRQDLWDSGQVRSVADLRGRLIAGQAQGTGSSNDIYLAYALRTGGLTEADVEVQALSFPEINAAMANKSIDVGWQNEPLLTQGVEQGLFQRLSCLGDVLPGYQISYVSYSPDFRQTEAARRFMVAYLRGARDFDDAFFKGKDRDAMISIMAQKSALKDPAVWQKITAQWSNPDGTISVDQLLSDQDFYLQNGYLDTKADLTRVVDPQFTQQAVATLGPYQQ
ncbi:MAG TPA: ABC transporter substrate-binding protein [Chloroflexota bacterium]|jgi:NitT/TauT family transport system substrate-binding protein